jgi:AcrR family transcriptional regulator
MSTAMVRSLSPTTVEPPDALATRRHTDRERELLQALETIVLTRGFSSLRLADLAEELNTSYSTLYGIAPSKTELIDLVVDRWCRRTGADGWTALAELDDPVERVACWQAAGADALALCNPVFQADLDTSPSVRAVVERYRSYYLDVLIALLQDGIDRGRFRSVNLSYVATVWEAAYRAGLSGEVLDDHGMTEADGLRFMHDLLLRGILAAPTVVR